MPLPALVNLLSALASIFGHGSAAAGGSAANGVATGAVAAKDAGYVGAVASNAAAGGAKARLAHPVVPLCLTYVHMRRLRVLCTLLPWELSLFMRGRR